MQNGSKMACNVRDYTNTSDCRKSVFSIKHKACRQNATLITSRQQWAQQPWNQTLSHSLLTCHIGIRRKDLLGQVHHMCIHGQRYCAWQGHESRRHNSKQSTWISSPLLDSVTVSQPERKLSAEHMWDRKKDPEVGKPEMVASLTSRAQDVTVSFFSWPPPSDHQMLTSILLHHSDFASNHMDLILSLTLFWQTLVRSIGSPRFRVTKQCTKMYLPFTDRLQCGPLILTKDKTITSVNVRISSFSLSWICWRSSRRQELSLILCCFGLLRTPGG